MARSSSCTGGSANGVYYVMQHAETGGRIEQVGRFYDLDAAIGVALTVVDPTATRIPCKS